MRSSTLCTVVALALFALLSCVLPARSTPDASADEPAPGLLSTPEIHSALYVDASGKRQVTIHGAELGSEKGQVWVGGRRARVREWANTSVTVRVARRLRGGVHAVELRRYDAVRTPDPGVVLLPGRAPKPGRLAFRVGRKSKRHTVSSRPQVEDDALVAAYSRTRRTTGFRWVTERRRRCSNERVCFFVIFCGTRRVCRYVPVRVRERFVKVRTWTVDLHAHLDGADVSTPLVLSAATQGDCETSPITCIGPKTTVFDVDPTSPDWWIVVGRDEDGTICGEFHAVTRDRRVITGQFAGLPE